MTTRRTMLHTTAASALAAHPFMFAMATDADANDNPDAELLDLFEQWKAARAEYERAETALDEPSLEAVHHYRDHAPAELRRAISFEHRPRNGVWTVAELEIAQDKIASVIEHEGGDLRKIGNGWRTMASTAGELLEVARAWHEECQALYGVDNLEARCAAAREHDDALQERILATPATTVDGFMVKLAMAEFFNRCNYENNVTGRLTEAAFADALAVTGMAPVPDTCG